MEENALKSNCKVLLIGGSAGSLEVLMAIIPKLKLIHTFAVVIILHRKSADDSTLENLIAMKTAIPVVKMEDKEILRPGFIYIAPSDYHLLFEKCGFLSLDVSEKVNYSRPSIDVSFESAALAFGDKCIAILLSGANTDGTDGLIAIQKAGGQVILQNPKSAVMPFMLQNALDTLTPNYILDVGAILKFINSIQTD